MPESTVKELVSSSGFPSPVVESMGVAGMSGLPADDHTAVVQV